MVRFVIGNPKYTFQILTNPPSEELFDIESWQITEEHKEIAEQLKKDVYVTYTPVILPSPLSYANVILSRAGDVYNARVALVAENDKAFNGLSARLKRRYREKWMPAEGYSGTGFLVEDFDGEVSPLIGITVGGSLKTRLIGIGTFGTKSRKLVNAFEFESDLAELEVFTSSVISFCLENSPVRGSKRDRISRLCLEAHF